MKSGNSKRYNRHFYKIWFNFFLIYNRRPLFCPRQSCEIQNSFRVRIFQKLQFDKSRPIGNSKRYKSQWSLVEVLCFDVNFRGSNVVYVSYILFSVLESFTKRNLYYKFFQIFFIFLKSCLSKNVCRICKSFRSIIQKLFECSG